VKPADDVPLESQPDKPKEQTPTEQIKQVEVPITAEEEKQEKTESENISIPEITIGESTQEPVAFSTSVPANDAIIDKLLAEGDEVEVNLDSIGDEDAKSVNSDVDIEEILNKNEDEIEVDNTMYTSSSGFQPKATSIPSTIFQEQLPDVLSIIEAPLDYIVASKKAFLTNIVSLDISEVPNNKATMDNLVALFKIEQVRCGMI
jgi:hypothetical protein